MKLQGPILVGTDFSGHHIAVNRVEELRGRSRPAPNADAGATGVARSRQQIQTIARGS